MREDKTPQASGMGESCGVGRDESDPGHGQAGCAFARGACAGKRAATLFPTETHTFPHPPRLLPTFIHSSCPQERPKDTHATALLAIRTRPDTVGDDTPHIRAFPRPPIHSPTCAAAKGSCGFKTFTCFM